MLDRPGLCSEVQVSPSITVRPWRRKGRRGRGGENDRQEKNLPGELLLSLGDRKRWRTVRQRSTLARDDLQGASPSLYTLVINSFKLPAKASDWWAQTPTAQLPGKCSFSLLPTQPLASGSHSPWKRPKAPVYHMIARFSVYTCFSFSVFL